MLEGTRLWKRPNQEPQNNIPAKKPAKDCLSSMSEENTLDSEDFQTLMAKVVGDNDEPGSEDKDQTLTEMQKEYEYKDSFGKNKQNLQFLGKLFGNQLLDKVLKKKLEKTA